MRADLLSTTKLIVKLKECEQQENDLNAIREELAQIAVVFGGGAVSRREQHDQLARRPVALPLFARLHSQREEFARAANGPKPPQSICKVSRHAANRRGRESSG